MVFYRRLKPRRFGCFDDIGGQKLQGLPLMQYSTANLYIDFVFNGRFSYVSWKSAKMMSSYSVISICNKLFSRWIFWPVPDWVPIRKAKLFSDELEFNILRSWKRSLKLLLPDLIKIIMLELLKVHFRSYVLVHNLWILYEIIALE